MTPDDVLEYAKKNNIKFVDMRFSDWLGPWQHYTVPLTEFSVDSFTSGFRLKLNLDCKWRLFNHSDIVILPDPHTAIIDPFLSHPTLVMICHITDPETKKHYSGDPRFIALKAESYLKSTSLADITYFGIDSEFFLFNNVRYRNNINTSFAEVDSIEGHWNSFREENPNLGHKPKSKESYMLCPPGDTLQDIRSEMVFQMQGLGIKVKSQCHGAGTAGQCSIGLSPSSLLSASDQFCWFKYIVKDVAYQNNLSATFMPKPLFGDSGSGMNTFQSLWKGEKPLFSGNSYDGMSEMALFYIGGILKHAASICAFSNPTTNSYKRLVPGFEAPIYLGYSSKSQSTAVRTSRDFSSEKRIGIEFLTPDSSCNPYLAFSAMLMAGIDGIQNKIDPGKSLDSDLSRISVEELKAIPTCPSTLSEALDSLEKDYEYLLKGDVFSQEGIEKWLKYKRKNEVRVMAERPHPMEFELYYDV